MIVAKGPTILGIALGLCGCLEFEEGRDAKVPGEALGTYEVTGKLNEDSCEAPMLGVVDPWRFSVKLSRKGDDLYWLNGREAIVGDIDADKLSFSFSTRVDVKLEEAKGRNPGCIFERADVAAGQLSAADDDVESFAGTLKFTYKAKGDVDCSAWIGAQNGFHNLPCTVAYDVSAARVATPGSE